MNKTIMHIDMDAFCASVEQLDKPSLKGKPVIVGGISNRGVVSAASYEARRFGIHSAMPIFQAKKRCPHGVFTPVRMGRYKEISQRIMEILAGFSPVVEQVSIDEAYMDITGTEKLLGSPEEVGDSIKKEIREQEGLTCSVGIASNRFLAKVASDMEKPDGLTIIRPDETYDFVQGLGLEKVPGIGKATIKLLHRMGAYRLGDIHRIKDNPEYGRLGKLGARILGLAKGIDDTPVVSHAGAKSISSENTLQADTGDISILKKHLLSQAETVGRRLRKHKLKGATVTLKLKTSNFRQMTRSVTISKASNSSQDIYKEALTLLKKIDPLLKFRLIGVGVSNLISSDSEIFKGQMDLFKGPEKDSNDGLWGNAEEAMDRIKEKFGNDAIRRGLLMERDPQDKDT